MHVTMQTPPTDGVTNSLVTIYYGCNIIITNLLHVAVPTPQLLCNNISYIVTLGL